MCRPHYCKNLCGSFVLNPTAAQKSWGQGDYVFYISRKKMVFKNGKYP